MLLWGFRAGLWALPFRRVEGLSHRLSGATGGAHSVAKVVWAVETGGRYTPAATCLVKALAGRVLLEKSGHPTTLRIGVRGGEKFEAHAWVESGGRAVIGDIDLNEFRPIASFGEPRSRP